MKKPFHKEYPFLLFLIFILSTPSYAASAFNDCIQTSEESAIYCDGFIPANSTGDSLVLVALYNATNGANWTNTWDLTMPMDTWYGVTLNGSRCVLKIFLSNNNLNGTIPPQIGNLSSLIELSFPSSTLISGSIPPEIGNLANLTTLNLFNCNLSGSIPPELGDLSNLNILSLGGNNLTGSIPPELSNLSSLLVLWLPDCNLNGNIPPELSYLTSLLRLNLSSNNLSGCIPQEFTNLCYLTTTNFGNICSPNPDCQYDFSNNPNLPNGGDFVAFCTNGSGACTTSACFPVFYIPDTINTGIYKADVKVISDGTVISGNNVSFKAGQEIELNGGFEVSSGGVFCAEIETCF